MRIPSAVSTRDVCGDKRRVSYALGYKYSYQLKSLTIPVVDASCSRAMNPPTPASHKRKKTAKVVRSAMIGVANHELMSAAMAAHAPAMARATNQKRTPQVKSS